MNNQKNLARIEKKQNKFNKKDEKYFAKYGVHLDPDNKKESSKIKYLYKFLPYFKPERFKLIFLLFIMIALVGLSILTPTFLSKMIDYIAIGATYDAIKYALIYSGTLVALAFIYMAMDHMCLSIFTKVAHNIRIDLIEKLSRVKIAKFNETSSGEILSRINNDPNNFADEAERLILRIPTTVRQFGRLCVAFVFGWKVGLTVLIGGMFIYIFATLIVKKKITPANKLSSKTNDNYTAQSNEMIKGIRDIKSLNIFGHFFTKFRATSNHMRNAKTTAGRAGIMMEELVYGATLTIAEFALFIVCIFLIANNELSIGVLSTLLIYDFDMFNTFVSISQIGNYAQNMEVCAKRMYEIYDDSIYPKETFGATELENANGRLTFENVDFSYNEKPVFENLNFDIQPGECIGIVGRSGEGKSTILNLIPRIFDVEGGAIKIDGVNVKDLTQNSLRETVSVVPQAPYIFNMSIRDNLKLVKDDATEDELRLACQKACILDFIESKEQGFDTIVGEGGVILSGGQKQRLAIARAFLKQSKILLLDEATSALDNESQGEIKKSIQELKKTCTIVIVAHRLSTVSDCDRIFVLDNHKLLASGSHQDLMQTCEVYQNLYKQEN